jgi:diaminopimelate decarboxylase
MKAREVIAKNPVDQMPAIIVHEVVQRFGTPTFIYENHKLIQNINSFKQTWEEYFPKSCIYYSYKTNYLPHIVATAHEAGLGADAVSFYELQHAQRHCKNQPVVFNGPMKTREELELAIELDAVINVDCLDDLAVLKQINSDKQIRLGLRVTPCQPVYDSVDDSYVAAHKRNVAQSKFGWSVHDGSARHAVQNLVDNGFVVDAVHCQLGSQITDCELFLAAVKDVVDFILELRASDGIVINTLNVGGGFGVYGLVRKREGWKSKQKQQSGGEGLAETAAHFDLDRFCSSLRHILDDHDLADLKVCCEPGRYLVSDTMTLVSSVVGCKDAPDNPWIIVDGGLNIFPTVAMGETRDFRFVKSTVRDCARETKKSSIGGPLCYEDDVLYRNVDVPSDVVSGDYLMIADAGAYTVSRSTNFIRPKACVVAYDGSAVKEIWRRESYEDIFQFSSI